MNKDRQHYDMAATRGPGKRSRQKEVTAICQSVQTKMTILSPSFKDLLVNTMRKDIMRKNDGYDTDDDVPLSWLRRKDSPKQKQVEDQTINTNDGQAQTTTDPVNDPNKGVIEKDEVDCVRAGDETNQPSEMKHGEDNEVNNIDPNTANLVTQKDLEVNSEQLSDDGHMSDGRGESEKGEEI